MQTCEGLKLVRQMVCMERKLANLLGKKWILQYLKCVNCQAEILVHINKCNEEN